MTVNPLFIASKTLLLKQLKLDGATTYSSDTVDDAIMTVRVGFYRRLGKIQVAKIIAINYVENADDDNEILRALANTTETLWTRLVLMRTLPMLSMDANGKAQQLWNEEAPFREMNEHDRSAEIKRLEADLEANLGVLAGDQEIGNESKIDVSVIEPECKPGRIGSSIRRWRDTRQF